MDGRGMLQKRGGMEADELAAGRVFVFSFVLFSLHIAALHSSAVRRLRRLAAPRKRCTDASCAKQTKQIFLFHE